MRITDLLKIESIEINSQIENKSSAIEKLVDLMDKGNHLIDKEQYKKDILSREEIGTTGLADGIATPHAKSKGVKTAGLSAMTIPNGSWL